MKRKRKIEARVSDMEKENFSKVASSLGLTPTELVRLFTYLIPALQARLIDINEFIDDINKLRASDAVPYIKKKRKVELPAPAVDPELVSAINSIGNNVNQIAKRANEDTKAGTLDIFDFQTDVRRLAELLEDIKYVYHRDVQQNMREELKAEYRAKGVLYAD